MPRTPVPLVNIFIAHHLVKLPSDGYFGRSVNALRQALGTLCLVWTLHAAVDDRLLVPGPPGRPGGRLVSAQRTEPKTLNWTVAADSGSREVLRCLMADLIHINRQSMATEPALAKSWKVSPDGLHWELQLRQGLKFSDGHPFDADDVVFTFQAILDQQVHSPQRTLLMMDGKPIGVRKLDPYRVAFDLPGPYSVPDRLFDGVFVLPRHQLEAAWKQGRLADAWPLTVAASQIAGLGPFRLKEYVAGQRITLERNPYYWKVDQAGTQLPYLSELVFVFAGSEDNQVLRFQAGESDIVNRVGARNFAILEKDRERRGYQLADAGSSLEYSFLLFNLAGPPSPASPRMAGRPAFLRRQSFRQAVSAAIDRDAIVRLVYLGRAVPLAGPVPPGNKAWIDTAIPAPTRSVQRARQLLAADGFQWSREGALTDAEGRPVEFSILTSNNNPERLQMATLIQDDLKQIGMRVNVVQLEFRSLLERVQRTHEYDACVLSLASSDADPNPDMVVWLSSGGNHLWNPEQKTPATPWEAEIDRLMRRQLVTRQFAERKRLFDRVQAIVVANQPLVPLVSPHLLAGAKKDLANFHPVVIEPYTLWNVEQLYWRAAAGARP
jgi:peptide/nickel transport system substrate-binding protein